MKIGVYPGTFDPITNGHCDIVERALEIFDMIHVAIAENPTKKTLFTFEERYQICQELYQTNPKVQVHQCRGLIVNFIKKINANVLIRGIRAVSDFEYEFQMALMNRKMAPKVETVFLMPREEYSYLNSSIIKQLAKFNAPIDDLVPEIINKKLKEKFS